MKYLTRNTNAEPMWRLAKSYTHFFPLFAEDGNTTGLAPLKGLDDYHPPEMTVDLAEHMASVAGFLIDR